VSVICSLNLSISFVISSALAVSTYTSTHCFTTQYAKFISFSFLSTNSILSAFTIQAIKSRTQSKKSAFLFFAYILTQTVLFGIILFSALRFLISLIILIIKSLSFSTFSFLLIFTFPQFASIKSQLNHNLV
jgi:hypothetical protein